MRRRFMGVVAACVVLLVAVLALSTGPRSGPAAAQAQQQPTPLQAALAACVAQYGYCTSQEGVTYQDGVQYGGVTANYCYLTPLYRSAENASFPVSGNYGIQFFGDYRTFARHAANQTTVYYGYVMRYDPSFSREYALSLYAFAGPNLAVAYQCTGTYATGPDA